ncbi:MAG: hypothetical protein WDN49_02595 [Acetobacteraceae bacterium]
MAGRCAGRPAEVVVPRGGLVEIFHPPYRSRTIMLVIFNVFQTVGFYGFANWVPTLLIKQGITTTSSLLYTFIIAIAAPFGPLLASVVADKVERKWLIVAAAGSLAVFGLLFSQVAAAVSLIVCGVMLTMSSNIMSLRLPRLPGGAVPDPHPRRGGGVRLFLQPPVGRVQRLRHRVLPAGLRGRWACSPSSPAAW